MLSLIFLYLRLFKQENKSKFIPNFSKAITFLQTGPGHMYSSSKVKYIHSIKWRGGREEIH